MLTGLNQLFNQFISLFQWWVVIAPWEMAIRVRRGKMVSVLKPGIHFRIPGLDRFFVQRTRKRYSNTSTQAITTTDGKAITVSGGTAFSIGDIARLYDTLSDPQDVIEIETMSLVARFVSSHPFAEISTEAIQTFVNQNLHLEQYGLTGIEFVITDFVCVRTIRLINSNPKDYMYGRGMLNTSDEKQIGSQGPS